MRARLPLFAGLTLIALALGLGSYAIADGIRNRNQNNVITVTGSAKQRIVSDYVIWDVSVTSQQASAAAAAKELAGWTDRTSAFLRQAGALASEITVQPVSTSTVTNQQGAVTAYSLTRNFEVRSSRVQAIAALAEQSSQLLAEGIPLTAQPLQYVYTKLAALRPRLVAAAAKDAQSRARVLIAATGGHLGQLRSVNVGVFQVTSPNSTEVTDYGVYDTSTLQKDVTAVVNVTFALS